MCISMSEHVQCETLPVWNTMGRFPCTWWLEWEGKTGSQLTSHGRSGLMHLSFHNLLGHSTEVLSSGTFDSTPQRGSWQFRILEITMAKSMTQLTSLPHWKLLISWFSRHKISWRPALTTRMVLCSSTCMVHFILLRPSPWVQDWQALLSYCAHTGHQKGPIGSKQGNKTNRFTQNASFCTAFQSYLSSY